jgi:LemA protein
MNWTMSHSSLLSIAATVVLVLWLLGAYNRLMRLKNSIGGAFAPLDACMKQRHDLLTRLGAAVQQIVGEAQHSSTPPDTSQSAAANLLTASRQVQLSSDAVRAQPASAQAVSTLVAAEQVLTTSLDQLITQIENSPTLSAHAQVRELDVELSRGDNQLAFLRQTYNDAVVEFNQAAAQFPTLIVAKLFGLRPSVPLEGETPEVRSTLRLPL